MFFCTFENVKKCVFRPTKMDFFFQNFNSQCTFFLSKESTLKDSLDLAGAVEVFVVTSVAASPPNTEGGEVQAGELTLFVFVV